MFEARYFTGIEPKLILLSNILSQTNIRNPACFYAFAAYPIFNPVLAVRYYSGQMPKVDGF
jgi:hypothetical protein